MNDQDKSKEELIQELLELRQIHNSLQATYEADLLDHKLTEMELKASEERLQLLFDKAPLGYQSLDSNGNFLEVNQQWLDTLGYEREEVIGKWFGDFLSPVFKDEFRKRFPVFKEHGKIHSEFEMVHKDGKLKIIGFDGRIGYDTNGSFKQTHCILQDITEERQAKWDLLRSRELLKSMEKAAKIGGWEFDVETMSQTWTEEVFQILEIDTTHGAPEVPEGIGFIAPEFQPMALLGIQRAIELGEPYNQEWQVITAKGNKRWVNAIATPHQENGKTKSVAGSFQDITERKQAEIALAASEERYRSLLDNLEAGIVLHAPDTSVVMNNSRASDLLGLNNDQMRGKAAIDPTWKFINEDSTPLPPEGYPVSRIVSGRQPIKNQVLGIPQPGKNKIVWVTVNGFPVLNKSGEIAEIVISFIDITERKNFELLLQEKSEEIEVQNEEYQQLNEDLNQTNQELAEAKERAEESDRLKTAFLANMSHEIRTPMNGILGFAELLKTPDLSGEEQQQFIKIIEKSGARMLNIINDIVDISKIEAGLMKADIKESNINEQIEYIYSFFKPEVEARGMKISYRNSLPAKEAIIKSDREKVYAILTNLVKNAIKYTNEGSIEFGYDLVEKDNYPFLQFYVKDTGIGIPKNRHDTIFKRFIQVDITDKMALQGAGLGLSITKAYVELLGGKIWVESWKGMGSIFYFTLPYHSESVIEPNDQQFASSGKYENIRKLKILIAEDDEASEMLIDIIVKKFGKEILKARTGVEAVEACRDNPDLDLLLMDIRLPEMDGYQATRQIREFNHDVVIIAQTAYGLAGDREKAIEAGCSGYLSKPINKDELLHLIQKYFKK